MGMVLLLAPLCCMGWKGCVLAALVQRALSGCGTWALMRKGKKTERVRSLAIIAASLGVQSPFSIVSTPSNREDYIGCEFGFIFTIPEFRHLSAAVVADIDPKCELDAAGDRWSVMGSELDQAFQPALTSSPSPSSGASCDRKLEESSSI